MELYYQILLATNIPNPILTYKIPFSEVTPISFGRGVEGEGLVQGQMVSVPVRGRVVYGVVLESLDHKSISYDIDKVQSIETIYSYILPEASLKLIRIFNLATFNNAGLILETILHPFLSLADKHRTSILEHHQSSKHPLDKGGREDLISKADKIAENKPISVVGNYDFDISIPSRIMYLIRIYSQMTQVLPLDKGLATQSLTRVSTILIVCPEVKMLNQLYGDIHTLIEPKDNIELLQYTSNINQKNRSLVIEVMKGSPSPNPSPSESPLSRGNISNSTKELNPTLSKTRVILTTRAGLFLPYGQLEQVILVDEANSMYYQDSNSLYYDTRELVLWIQRSYHCYLDFVSNFPSIRLRSFNEKAPLEASLNNSSAGLSKSINIQLSHYDSRMTQNRIFGPQIEALLDDEIGGVME